ncbi:hypothetical protein H5410_042647 [Solanum commersonii]|uniref:Integrase core domain containing protein n=1 Tax=Solanum commersonii TaxID=4109 RepID=A0A9J5XWA1_SOLCO|nr:hypothetical protein H5410_042647 [Solanum commersonii]
MKDQLIRNALVAFLSSEVVPLVLSADTSFDVWTTLHNTYARPSRARLLGLKESLSQATKGTQSMLSYLQHIKQLVTTLNSAGETLTMDDITLHVIYASRPTTETLSTWAPHFVLPMVSSSSTKSAPSMVTHYVNISFPCCLTSPRNDHSSNELMGISSGHGSSPSCINSRSINVPPVVSTSSPTTVQITGQWQTESSNAPSSSPSNITTSPIPQSKPVPPSHSMIIRSKNNIHKPANKLCLSTQITNKSPLVQTSNSSHKSEPKNISQSLKDLD